jgi:ketosteroid isomerase-like protein
MTNVMRHRQIIATWRKVMLKLALASILPILLSSCAQPAGSKQSVSDSLEAMDADLQKAVAARDLDKIVNFYADDAVLMPAAEPIASGKAAIREEWHHILEIPDFQNQSNLTRSVISKSGDLAYSMGTYTATLRGEDGQLAKEPGKWLTVWGRQADGSWRILADMYNTDIPPPDHK